MTAASAHNSQQFQNRFSAFVRREPVFCVSLLAAVASAFAVPPSAAYAGYINWTLLATLLAFMLCVAGLRSAGVFSWLAKRSLAGGRSVGAAVAVLTALPFFAGMLVTNDVALIAFVPFALVALGMAGRADLAAITVVLQAIAANMGSMLTPFGNPQNLYIYEVFGTPAGAFFGETVLPTLLNGGLLALCVALIALRAKGSRVELPADVSAGAPAAPAEGERGAQIPEPSRVLGLDALLFGAAFVVCVLRVLGVVPVWVMLAVCAAVAAARNWRLVLRVDWCLLGTFLCFFIFSGNLAAIPAVHDALTAAMAAHPFAIPLAASQVISNVPAAVLLSPFTDNWQALLLAVDMGGLGTPIASLASLIALGFYRKQAPAGSAGFGRCMGLFLLLNVVFLALNCGFYALVLM